MPARVLKRSLWIGLVIGIVVSIFLLRAWAMTLIIEPIAWLLWAGWRILASVDRGVLWVLLVVLCAVLLFRMVPLTGGPQDEGASRIRPRTDSLDRLDHWEAVVASADRSHEDRAALITILRELAGTVAAQTKMPPPPAAPAVRDGTASALARLLPGFRRRLDLSEINRLLDWMESSLEIKDED